MGSYEQAHRENIQARTHKHKHNFRKEVLILKFLSSNLNKRAETNVTDTKPTFVRLLFKEISSTATTAKHTSIPSSATVTPEQICVLQSTSLNISTSVL